MRKEKVKPLRIPPKRRVSNLYVFCNACSKRVASSKGEKNCGKSGKRLSNCIHGEKQVYKAIVTIPNTGSSMRKTRCFDSRNIDEVIPLVLAFEEELATNNYHRIKIVKEETERSNLLIHRMADFMDYLNNIGVVKYKQKERTIKHIKEIERFFRYFCRCLKGKGINFKLLKTDEVNETIVGHLHDFILKNLKYGNRSYNKFIASMRQFYKWHTEESGVELKNPFEGIHRRRTKTVKQTISKKEFDQLLSVINLENGILIYSSGEKKSMYRSWLKIAFRLALETGLRREEFMTLQYSDIFENEEGELLYLKQENYKVNRIKKYNKEEEKEIKHVPITKSLKSLLVNELEYHRFKGKKRFLIAPDELANRKTLMDVTSKAFTVFWKLVDPSKKIQLQHLRKTYISNLYKVYGAQAAILTSHSSVDVMKEHYIDETLLMNAAKDFEVFGGD